MGKKQTVAAKAKEAENRTGDDILDSIFDKMATEHSIPAGEIATILRNTAFKAEPGDKDATTSEMKALLSVAEKYKLNPFIREIFAFRNKKGVLVPVVSVDGWIKIMNSQEKFEGFEFVYSENMIKIDKSKNCFEWIEIVIHRSDRKYPIPIREYLDECYVKRTFTSPWDTHTKRMLRHKTISQGVRVAFGVNDVVDLDEAQRIDDALEAEINRGKDLEKPETAGTIKAEPEAVEPAPKVLNEKKDYGTGGDGVPDIEPEKIPPPPEKKVEPEIETPATEIKEPVAQADIFTNEKTETPVEKKDEIPDLF